MHNHPIIVHLVEEKEVEGYPYVGDVVLIKEPIGSYLPGDLFFVHSQDEDEVSDCSLVGVSALNVGLDETILTDLDFFNDRAEVITDLETVDYLWTYHLASHMVNLSV